MSMPAKRKAVYDDLYRLPENMTGEIIEGELHAFPRPHYRHSSIESTLSGELIPPYRFGRGGGPGGWIFLIEPEVMLGENLLVPDLAGWKQERLPVPPTGNWTTIVPDWVCEILSPSTFRIDRVRKMPIYATHGVPFLWLIDPIAKLLETFKLKDGAWTVLNNYAENDKVRVEPFQEIEFDLSNLWWGD
ncbi:MAG: Uma2 family endonuclease [Deltaproteobacteria bacterium]|nr:Uma2 family endonuclease [Deltaproteobacteria bacterium]